MVKVRMCVCLAVVLLQGVLGESNHILGSSREIRSGDELVASVIDSCFDGDDSVMRCIKLHALSYLDNLAGPSGEGKRSLEDQERSLDSSHLDELVLERVQRMLDTHQFKVRLPEMLFQEATLTIRPAQGEVDMSFPTVEGESRASSEARDMMKDKLLLPLLLLLKIKLKALTPILVAMVGMKALKALILSKISILLVVGFLAVQLFKKVGMMKEGMMMMEPAPPAPGMAYGPPTPPAQAYGAPSAPPPPVTMSSYEPSWEPSPGGPYKRVWEPQQVVYSAYLNPPANNQGATPQQSNSS